jgi:hypothetical protein
MKGVTFNRDAKFDLQLSQALIHERRMAEIFSARRIERIELKSESWQWEHTGNICIEYQCDGRPSGIAVTEADYWVHELLHGNSTLCYLMFPLDRLRELARRSFVRGRIRHNAGDGGRFTVALLPLSEILR